MTVEDVIKWLKDYHKMILGFAERSESDINRQKWLHQSDGIEIALKKLNQITKGGKGDE